MWCTMYVRKWKHSGRTEPSSNYRKCVCWEMYLLTDTTGERSITMRVGSILRVNWPALVIPDYITSDNP